MTLTCEAVWYSVSWLKEAKAMNLINFMQHFPDEESCEIYLKAYREKAGVRCKSCQKVTKHYWFSGGKFFECSKCRRRSSLKSGTVMEKSKLPLQIWLLAIMLISATKKGFSCLEFQRQLSLSRYETAFKLMHKIRVYMGKRDALFTLSDMVEYNECYVSVATKKAEIRKLKRGKGSQRKASVAVAAESVPVENPETGETSKVCGYFKMEVLQKVNRHQVNSFIKKNINGDIALFTDKNTAYVNLEDIVTTHFTVV